MPQSSPPDAAVLLVDDRPENLQAFEAALAPLSAALGVRLLRASGADEALRHVLREGEAIAVILLDVMMPGTDGMATARLIRERRATEQVPIIFVTALDADRQRVAEGYLSGAVDYLAKPVDPDVLAAKVHAFVELYRRRAAAARVERRRFADRVAATEAAARATETRLQAVLDSLPDAVGVFDAGWRWRYANPAMRELLHRQGHDPDGAIGSVLWAQMPELRATPFEAALRRARDTGQIVEYEEHVAGLDAWYEQRVVPGPDDTVTVYSRDVSTRWRAQAALRESEARLRPIMASGIVGLFVWHVAGGITEANDAFLAMLGFTRDDLAAGRVDWRRLTPAEYAASDAERVAELLATGAHGPYEKAYLARDGRAVPVLVASAFLEESRERGVCLCIDLTVRRRAEAEREEAARSARLLQQVTAAFSAVLTQEAVVDALLEHGVPALGAATGLVMLRSADGTALERVGDRGYPEGFAARFARVPLERTYPATAAVRTGAPVWLESREAAVRAHPDGRPVYEIGGFQATAALPLVDGAGGVFGALVFNFAAPRRFGPEARDVIEALARQCAQALERARLFEAERAARAEAEQSNRAKSEFLAVMSHELRTPLNAIGGYAELIELGIRGPVTPAQREDLERIRKNQRHLLGLINEVLNFARIETGAVHYAADPVPLPEVVASIEPLVAPQLAAKALRYEVAAGGEPVPVARADREKVRQVLLNLLSNAIKFTDAGGSIAVTCEAAGDRVAVRVRDSGVGIAPAQLGHVFEPFVQINANLTRTEEGVGLGLAISRDLARGMGGDLTVESAVGVGSTFTLTLPPA